MPFVQAKCVNCGAALEVDDTKDAAVCPYCNTPYIVEKAIRNYYNSNHVSDKRGMETNDLKEYLGMILDTEKNLYIFSRLQDVVKKQIAALTMPTLTTLQPPTMGNRSADGVVNRGFLIGLVGAIISVIIKVNQLKVRGENPIQGFLEIIGAIILGAIIGALLGTIGFGVHNQSLDETKFEQDKINYQNRLSSEQDRFETEKAQYYRIRSALVAEQLDISSKKKHFEEVLQELYKPNVIFEKYRGFPRIASFYEYFCSGRCSSMEGKDGAYNLLEEEIRRNIIISQPSIIIAQPDQIKGKQYMLYTAIQDANHTLDQIIFSNDQINKQLSEMSIAVSQVDDKLSELQKTSALSSYYEQQLAKELAYMNRMDYYANKYDNAGFFMRRPPVKY